MGFFNKLFNSTKDYNRIANAVSNVKVMLDNVEYNDETDMDAFLIIAWICRVGVIDVIEKNNWPMAYRLFIPINGHHTRMTLNEAYMMSVGRLSIKAGELGNNKIKDAIMNILDKGEWFYKIDQQIPESKKAIFT